MTGAAITLQRADDATRSYVEALLEQNDLPWQDVEDNPDCFYVAYDDEEPVGIGGIEPYGVHGLLRSVVVEESARGSGVGTALCDELEAVARSNGIETLYLLTTTAAAFFADRGYVEMARAEAPTPIQRTTQFEDRCPATATCMKKSL